MLSHLGVFTGLKEIIYRENILALYKGNFAQMVRIFPYAATQFTAFEIYKKVSTCFILLSVPSSHYPVGCFYDTIYLEQYKCSMILASI
jgi:hypothetical protein